MNRHVCDFSGDTLSWCFSTLGCSELNIDEVVALATAYGIRAVEIRALSATINIAPIFARYRQEHYDDFIKITKSQLIKMIDTSFCLLRPTPKDFEALINVAKIADALGSPYCRVFGGFDYSSNPAPELIREAGKSLEQWRHMQEQHEIHCQLALETHDGFSSAQNCMFLFEEYGHCLPVIWDVHHTWRYGGESFEESFDTLKQSIVHVHVKDSLARKSEKAKAKLPGQGDVPIPRLLSILRACTFRGPVSLEWERLWEPEIPAIQEALSAMHKCWYMEKA